MVKMLREKETADTETAGGDVCSAFVDRKIRCLASVQCDRVSPPKMDECRRSKQLFGMRTREEWLESCGSSEAIKKVMAAASVCTMDSETCNCQELPR